MNSQDTQEPPRHERSERRRALYRPVLSAQDARQGTTDHNVRYVLGFGLAAIVLVFIGIYLIYFG
jgi:predicted transcriptional regulator